MTKSIRWVTLLLGLSTASVHSMPILQIDAGGELLGARGINVGGAVYDVAFVDGTCVALFSGCDNATDFPFPSPGEARFAAQALLDQVFLDVADGQFDSFPSRTFGCDFTDCYVVVPNGPSLPSNPIAAVNIFYIDSVDTTILAPFVPLTDTTARDEAVYSVWRLAAAPQAIAEPGSLALLGLALFALVLTRRAPQRQLSPFP